MYAIVKWGGITPGQKPRTRIVNYIREGEKGLYGYHASHKNGGASYQDVRNGLKKTPRWFAAGDVIMKWQVFPTPDQMRDVLARLEVAE